MAELLRKELDKHMIPYIEKFKVGDSSFGIEDYEDGKKDHFFPQYEHKRFKCWMNGCGLCSGFDTLAEARKFLHKYILTREQTSIDGYKALLKRHEEIRERLFGSVKNLNLFKEK